MSDTPDAIEAITAHHASPGEKFFPAFKVSPALTKEAKEIVALYPEGKEQSAVLPLIHLVQEKFGFVCADAIPWIAKMCKSTSIHVAGVVTFYPGIHRMCPGKFHVRVCRTIACAMSGGEELISYICEKTGIDITEMTEEEPMAVSPDGVWSIEPVECLAHCGFGPNVMINDKLYSQVDKAKVDELVEEYLKNV